MYSPFDVSSKHKAISHRKAS
jgi:hypothetical protein